MMKRYFIVYLQFFLFIAIMLIGIATHAQDSIDGFIDEMVARHGFARTTLVELFNNAKILNNVLRLTAPRAKKGKRRPWYLYRRNFITERHINGGVEYWRQHAAALSRAQAKYGVPAEIIVAIIGVETIYGKNTGNFRVLDALTTLAFYHPRRGAYFRQELENFLLLAREERLNPLDLYGSYAGAMGIGQFMPGSYRDYAVDFDGDGRRNIWTNDEDAIGSVANYFHRFGWQSGQPVMLPTQIRPGAVGSLLSLEFKPQYTLQQLKQQGLLFYGDVPSQLMGLVVDLETEQGTAYWVGFKNFYVITRYNHSSHYAMAVYQLAQRIAETYGQ